VRPAVAPLDHLLDGVDIEETCASSLQQPGSPSSALGSRPWLATDVVK
jgi:hypothetical protein